MLACVLVLEIGAIALPGFASASVLIDGACGLPPYELTRLVKGHRPDRGPDVLLVPDPPAFIGPGLPHVGPWNYVQQVPLFLYGPGHIEAVGRVQRPVTVADMAPTTAKLIGFPFPEADGRPLHEALGGDQAPQGSREGDGPKLVVTLVWDSSGRNVLSAWPKAWPVLSGLIEKGAWYERATVGSSPSSTAPIHATIGTGTFPTHHGVIGHYMRLGRDRMVRPWDFGPTLLSTPTLADLYDRSRDNEPKVGAIGTVALHLAMIGHGSMWGGGDEDLAIIRGVEGARTLGEEGDVWNLTRNLMPFFRFPEYAPEVGSLATAARTFDGRDGRVDGAWAGVPFAELGSGFETPARIPYQSNLVRSVIRRERFGADQIPDLLYVNYKLIDYVGHEFGMHDRRMEESLRAQDADLRSFIGFLNREVGRGEWVLALTADHGAMPEPTATGATVIDPAAVTAAIDRRFPVDDGSSVTYIAQNGVYLDPQLRSRSAEVARYLLGLNLDEVMEAGAEAPAPGAAAFDAVIPGDMLDRIRCGGSPEGASA